MGSSKQSNNIIFKRKKTRGGDPFLSSFKESQMSKEKIIQIRVPLGLYEEFYRRFSQKGEQKLVLLRLVELAIELSDQKACFIDLIRETALELYGKGG